MASTIKVNRLDGDSILIKDATVIEIDQNGWIEIHPMKREWLEQRIYKNKGNKK